MNPVEGNLSELFGSVQGEGLYAGERQIFVRTAGCGMICDYCDTTYGQEVPEWCTIYGHEMRLLPNPLDLETVLVEIMAMQEQWAPVATVSITGGEPLEQSEFVAALAEQLRAGNFRVHLDTNGVEADGLARAVAHIDVVAADIKLPSSCPGDHWDAHRRFLRIARDSTAEIFIKLVIDGNTLDEEVLQAVHLIEETDRRIPLVLQPESGMLFETKGATEALVKRVLGYQEMAAKKLATVRIIPQLHRVLGVR